MAEALRKLRDGVAYERPIEVEGQIDEIAALTGEERLRRLAILDRNDPHYVASECLVYFLRRLRGNTPRQYDTLYKILLRRVTSVLPGGWRRESGPVVSSEERVASAALARFREILAADYNGYDDRLDFFESDSVTPWPRCAGPRSRKSARRTEGRRSCPTNQMPRIQSRRLHRASIRLPPINIPILSTGFACGRRLVRCRRISAWRFFSTGKGCPLHPTIQISRL